jgi:hypothetical protein
MAEVTIASAAHELDGYLPGQPARGPGPGSSCCMTPLA